MSSPKSVFDTQQFASRLTETRRLRGLTQQELAERADFSLRSVQGWESGEGGQPRPGALRKLSELLRVPPSFLVGVNPLPAYDDDGGGARSDGDAADAPAEAPEWLAALGRRLQAFDEVRRQRLLGVLHSVLDVAETAVPPEPAPRVAPVAQPMPRPAPAPAAALHPQTPTADLSPAMRAARALGPVAVRKALSERRPPEARDPSASPARPHPAPADNRIVHGP